MKAKRLNMAKVIRLQCLDCSGLAWSEVERCTVIDCVLWPFRFGCYPETAEKRGKLVDPYKALGKEFGKGAERDTYKEIGPEGLWWETGVVRETSISEADVA